APHYRTRCLKCHEQHGCSAPLAQRQQTSPADNCLSCHMGASLSADIPHTAATDHRIPRRPRSATQQRSTSEPAAGSPIRSFHPLPGGRHDEERELGVALAELLRSEKIDWQFARIALARLESALAADPADADSWAAKAEVLLAISRQREAAEAFAQALALAPN